jgi:hypothetical protein
MGGVWGLASSTALENLPVEARGLASGVLQQGYAFGYLISAILNLFLVPRTHHGWRVLFWTTSGISAFAALIRALIPESEVFLRVQAQERAVDGSTAKKTKVFIHRVGAMLRQHWRLCIYAVLLMAGAFFLFLTQAAQADILQVSTSFRMAPKICTRPTSRRARASTIATLSSPLSLEIAGLSRPFFLPS